MTKKLVLGTIAAIVTISLIAATFTFAQGQPDNNPGQPFAQLEEQVQQILVIVGDPSSGNPEIKSEVSIIETVVTDSNFGLEEIKNEVSNIETIVTDPNFGLEEIKNEVSNIETILTAESCPGCTFVYTVKYTCQNVGTTAGIIYAGPFDLPYRTTVNIHNFQSQTVDFDVKAVGSKSMTLTPVAPSSKVNLQLLTDRGLHITCDNIKNNIPGAPALGDGFVVIESPDELDVVAVYTAGAGSFSSGRSFGTTMDIEYIEPHLVPPPDGNGGGA